MSEEQTTTEPTLAGDKGTPSSDGTTAGNGSISLEEINTILGKDFKDADTALKSVKDTFNYVGKAGQLNETMSKLTNELGMSEDGVISALQNLKQPAVPEVDPSKFISKEQYDTDMFYKDRTDLEPYRGVLDALAFKEGKTLGEVAESDTFKAIYEKASGFDEIQSKRSVLETNPRLNSASDKITNAQDALQESRKAAQAGDTVGAHANAQAAKRSAVSAVREAFDLN